MTDKEKLEMLIEAIDHSFLNTQGEYDKGLTYPVIDKVKFIKKSMQDDPASADLEAEIEKYMDKHLVGNSSHRKDYEMWGGGIARHFAEWQKQQMTKETITGQLENGEDYLRIKCLYTSCRPQDDGKLIKFIIIKED